MSGWLVDVTGRSFIYAELLLKGGGEAHQITDGDGDADGDGCSAIHVAGMQPCDGDRGDQSCTRADEPTASFSAAVASEQ